MIRPPRIPRALVDRMTGPRSLAIIAIVGGGYAWLAWWSSRHGGGFALLGVVILAPAAAFAIAAPLIGLFAGYLGWVDERTWAPWQGIYHAFDDHQIRVAEARGLLWFSSDDVHSALGLRAPLSLKRLRVTEYRRDDHLGDLLTNAGLVALFGRSTDRRTLRLVAWAERDVRGPWQNRRNGVTVDAADRRPPPPPSAAPQPRALS